MTLPDTTNAAASLARARALRAYERSRAWRATRWFLLAGPLAAVAVVYTERPLEVAGMAAILLGGVWRADWRGRDWGRALPAGLVGGLLTFGAAISARWVMGDCCATGEGCSDWCVPACSTAGGLAALVSVFDASRAERPLPRLATSASLAALGGAMGCACIGYAGAGAMLIAMGAVLVPGTLWARRRAVGG